MHRMVSVLLAVLMSAGIHAPVEAAELRQGETVTVVAGETVNDDLYAAGGTVQVLGTVNGDLIAAGGTVMLGGNVAGDVLAAGGTITISGEVRGSVRAAGGTVAIEGRVGEDVLVGSGTAVLAGAGGVGRDVLAAAGSVTAGGPVGRNLWAGAGDLLIGGAVGGNVRAEVENLRLGEGAALRGDLVYTSEREAAIAAGARVTGRVERLQPRVADAGGVEAVPGALDAVWGWLRAVVGFFLLGLPLTLLFPGFSRRASGTLRGSPLASVALGAGLAVALPALALLLFIVGLLAGGWWLGVVGLGLYALLLLLGVVVAALLAGDLALRAVRPGWAALPWALLLGLAALLLVGMVPTVGGIVFLVVLLAGSGALLLALVSAYRQGAPAGEAAG